MGDRRGHDHMVDGFITTVMQSVPITTSIASSIISDLRQVGGFFRVLWFPPPIKLTATIYLKYC